MSDTDEELQNWTNNMDVLAEVKALNLPLGHYVVVSSALLAVYGLREARDIDLSITSELFEQLRTEVGWEEKEQWGRRFLEQGIVEAMDSYPEAVPFSVEESIAQAQEHDGVPFMSFDHLITFKKALGRDKDTRDIALIKQYLKGHD